MSIADKLTTIAENQQRVYDAGFSAGQNSGYDEGFEAGKQAEYDAFWDAYQENGNRTLYVEAFNRHGWNEVTYKPKYPIIGTTYGLQSTFSNSQIKDTIVPVVVRGSGNMRATFNMCTFLINIPSLVLELPVTDLGNAFYQCLNLEEINVSCVNDGCFAGTLTLQQSTKLSKASIESIIHALSTTTSGLTLTLSETAVTNAFGSTTAGEWTDLIGTRSNWTITLV